MADHFDPFRQEAASSKAPIYPQAIEYNQFEKAPVEIPKSIIDNLLDDSSRMIFGGGSKTYKTWAMSEQAICISCGAPWWGFNTHQVKVLYVNFELKEFYAQRRFKAIREFKRLRIAPNMFLVWNLRGFDIPMSTFEPELIKMIRVHAIVVVFIDPFYRLLGESDERISSELMPLLLMFERINKVTGASVVCSAHFTKGNQAAKDPIDRISGGASIHRHPDSLITLTKHETDHAFTVDLTCRDFPPVNPFVVKWDHPLLVRTDLDPQKIKTPALGRQKHYSTEQILEVLADCDDQLSTSALQEKVKTECGMSSGKFYELFSQLKTDQKIFKSKLTQFWNIKA